jgi:hypothetical protein
MMTETPSPLASRLVWKLVLDAAYGSALALE